MSRTGNCHDPEERGSGAKQACQDYVPGGRRILGRGGVLWAVKKSLGCRFVLAVAALAVLVGSPRQSADAAQRQHPEFLIDHWSAREGLPENSALAIAQTPDGYLWVASSGGLLRFNAYEFHRVSRDSDLKQLDTSTHCLGVDSDGRLWASTSAGLTVLENAKWRLIEGPAITARTIAQAPGGPVFVGTIEGKLLQVTNGRVQSATQPPSLVESGVFLARDKRHNVLWLANRGFIGRWATNRWEPVGPQQVRQGALVATASRQGGLWVYWNGQLLRIQPTGAIETWPMPNVDQPRDLTEDSSGAVWVSSMSVGLVRWRLGEAVSVISATNGLTHSSARCLVEDSEGNLWAGTSSSGLFRLKTRRCVNPGAEDGLTDRIVKTITEVSPGVMLVGTHGGGTALIENNRVSWRPVPAHGSGAYTWSVLRDSSGRTWTGTYNSGLTVSDQGGERVFRLPGEMGPSVGALMEDSEKRIWVGTSLGLAVIENGVARAWPCPPELSKVNVRSVVEDKQGGALWVGTFGLGLWRVDLKHPGKASRVEDLPRRRITALAIDTAGYLWVGVFGEGLFCIWNGQTHHLGRHRGLDYNVGSILEDGRGYLWLGTDHGVARVQAAMLRKAIQDPTAGLSVNIFDQSDGMESLECTEGFQPCSARDTAGRLWFGTLRGVTRIDPSRLKLNERIPPVEIELFSFTDRHGTTHEVRSPDGELTVPAGSTGLEFRYSALSYAAPEKVRYAYQLDGIEGGEIDADVLRIAKFQVLPPGKYQFRVKAANNDGVWNEIGDKLVFTVQPFVWQTAWFKGLVLMGFATGIGLGGWRVARVRYRGQIERLEQQHALARERARLSAVMEATTDLVAFADHEGRVLHLNPAGRQMLGLDGAEAPGSLNLQDLFAPSAAELLLKQGIPTAQEKGTWQTESSLRRTDGTEIPVSQVVIAHKDPEGRLGFISTIVRDISEQKRASEERERLQAQLAQSQKLESVGRLAGGVAHDFNNALQVILGHVELALEHASPGSTLEEDLIEIRRSAKRSADLTGQLLAFGRKQMVTPRVLDVNSAIERFLPELRKVAGDSVQVTWRPAEALWNVKMDPAQLEQILTNLAANAREAVGAAGTLTLQTANMTVEQPDGTLPPDCRRGDYVLLTVADDGRGMPAQVVQHLFEPFFTTKGLGQGTGLGLATVFGIVKQSSGCIAVDSEPGRGTIFRIMLPRVDAATQTA